MLLYTALNLSFPERLKIVKSYLGSKKSLRRTAGSLGISYMTLWRWVKKYKKGGDEALSRARILHKKSAKKFPKDLEEKIMLIKEHDPSMSIMKARELLFKSGIKVSSKGIWSVWQRYGILKRPRPYPLSLVCSSTSELEQYMQSVKTLVRDGNFMTAAKILNDMPSLPKNAVIEEIPEEFLSPRRKLDRLSVEFGKIPIVEYHLKARQIRKTLEKQGYVYSSIIANFYELIALDYMKKPKTQAIILNMLARKMYGMKDSPLWFLFHFQQASVYFRLQKVDRALVIAKRCRRLLYHLPYPYYLNAFGALLTEIGNTKKASVFFKKALELENDPRNSEYYALMLALHGYSNDGSYAEGSTILNKIKKRGKNLTFNTIHNLTCARIALGQGKLADASSFYLESLKEASVSNAANLLYAISSGLAAIAMATNRKEEAKTYLHKYLALIRKHGLVHDALVLRSLQDVQKHVPRELTKKPSSHLLNLLIYAKFTKRIRDYRNAFNYAKRRGILGVLHRWVIFFPEIVSHVLEKGKLTGLPKAILDFPVFNQKIPAYHLKFLGGVAISKNEQYMKTKLMPKERALLIYLALKSGAPGKFIPLDDLYQNFWPNKRNPESTLLHLLSSLKKKLLLPGHLLSTSSRQGEPKLLNRGFHITTDYGSFKALVIQIRILSKANEWCTARNEYLRALRLFRGKPFERMYDNWSENLRRVILNQLEIETKNFAKDCLEHKESTPTRFLKATQQTLERITKIIPRSEEVDKFLSTQF